MRSDRARRSWVRRRRVALSIDALRAVRTLALRVIAERIEAKELPATFEGYRSPEQRRRTALRRRTISGAPNASGFDTDLPAGGPGVGRWTRFELGLGLELGVRDDASPEMRALAARIRSLCA